MSFVNEYGLTFIERRTLEYIGIYNAELLMRDH